MGELARPRSNGAAGPAEIREMLSNERHRFKLQAAHQRAKVHIPPVEKKKPKEANEANEVNPDRQRWLPKKEYLRKLVEGRNAAEATRKPSWSLPYTG